MTGARRKLAAKAAAVGALLVAVAAVLSALGACSVFTPNVGPYRDAGAASCTPTGAGYGGYPTATTEDAEAEGCGDAS